MEADLAGESASISKETVEQQKDAWAAYGYEIRSDDVDLDVEIRGNFFDMSKESRELVAAVINLVESFVE